MIGFARRWGFGGIVVVNLFAYRSTDPAFLDPHHEPTLKNDEYIAAAVRSCQRIVACWGAWPGAKERGQEVLALLKHEMVAEVLCFGTTQEGHPRHPVRLPYSVELVRFGA